MKAFRVETMLALLASAFPGLATEAPVRRVISVVRADVRTGRLVRAVQVNARTVAPVVVPPGAAAAPAAAAHRALSDIIDRQARNHNVDPLLVHSVIQVESGYNRFAVSHKGAQGLMQLIPATARRYGVKDAFDAEENIRAGVRHLKELQDRFQDDRLALAAYNAGEGAVLRYGNIPPYAETWNYVYQVGKRYGQARRQARPGEAPRPAASAAGKPAAPEHRPVEWEVDAEGRIHLRTR